MNCSLRFEKSFIRLRASLSDTMTRRGRSVLDALMVFSRFKLDLFFLLAIRNQPQPV